MDHFITFRSRRAFADALRLTAEARGIPVSQLIRETLSREISYRGLTKPVPGHGRQILS